MLLVGTKTDLRENAQVLESLKAHSKVPITYPQGLAMCKEYGFARYMECSAATDQKTLKVQGEQEYLWGLRGVGIFNSHFGS